MAVYLDASGTEFDVQRFLDEHDSIRSRASIVRNKGDAAIGRARHEDAGFRIQLVERCQSREEIAMLLKRLRLLSTPLTVARERGATLSLSFGLIVSPLRPMLSVRLPQVLLAELVSQQIEVSVSSYASSGE